MTKRLIAKLDKLAKLANELNAEAKALYGPEGNLFFEADGTFYLMDGDANGSSSERQEHVKAQSTVYCNMGCGAW